MPQKTSLANHSCGNHQSSRLKTRRCESSRSFSLVWKELNVFVRIPTAELKAAICNLISLGEDIIPHGVVYQKLLYEIIPYMNQTIELHLTGMTPTGQAIGRYNGRVIFVQYALPGEQVKAQIVHERREYAVGKLLEVISPSPMRMQPRCAHFGDCGGCEWQHITTAMQIQYKTQAVREQLKRIGKLDNVDVLECIASPLQYEYRNHTQFIVTGAGELGYHKANSRDVVPITECPILSPLLESYISRGVENKTLPIVKSLAIANLDPAQELHLRCGENTGEISIAMETHIGQYEILAGANPFHEIIHEHTFTISAGSFFQVNTGAAQLLVEQVLIALQPQSHESVLELYCGVGLFTLPICERAKYVLAVESSAPATSDARSNLAGHSNATIVTDNVSHWLTSNAIDAQAWDAIVLDPPRAGVDHKSLLSILRIQAHRIVYVSCDPATLARDAKIICNNGYQLIRVQPLDMFPQTHHVETVAVFMRLAHVETQ